ncbi:MAG: transcriptional repressor NrdR [Clostridia bacterium]|nr:transcriptional repressor NrdR [Clostridia bacterium]
MKCIFCGCEESKVVDSRDLKDSSIRRRRECANCGKRYTTYETIETNPMVVTNVDNEREAFKFEKLLESIQYAVYCTEIENQAGEITVKIEKSLFALNKQEITTADIVKIAIDCLKELDQIACLVYYMQHTSCSTLNDVRTFLGM